MMKWPRRGRRMMRGGRVVGRRVRIRLKCWAS